MAHPPLPLQSFLPGCLPPPWPLQSFLPLQECFGRSGLSWAMRTPACAVVVGVLLAGAVWAFMRTAVPPNRPANAAARARDCAEFFIEISLSWLSRTQKNVPDVDGGYADRSNWLTARALGSDSVRGEDDSPDFSLPLIRLHQDTKVTGGGTSEA